MKRKIMFAAAFFILLTGFAMAGDFSADVVFTGGGASFRGKIFSAKEKTRMETPQSVSITRMDRKVVWVLMPGEKMYMEQPLRPENVVVGEKEKLEGEVERNLVSTETVDGRAAKKYLVVYKAGGKTESVYQWVENSSGFTIKVAATDGRWTIEYKNLKAGKQPESLFEIPAGYKKFSMPAMPGMGPGGMPKGMGQ
ncbi:MAG: hypothetical protein HY883_00700 [Deltaproteobacteria bacterium]|nr:hypothetical protein [Deltaproteobacteria bacterium]